MAAIGPGLSIDGLARTPALKGITDTSSPPQLDVSMAKGADGRWRGSRSTIRDGRRTAPSRRARANLLWKRLLGEHEDPPFDPARRGTLEAHVARRKAEGGAPLA